MDISNMKNIVVLKDLPSNLVEEAIVVIKANKKIKKYQYKESQTQKNVNNNKKKSSEVVDNSQYIVKEAENVITHYISNLEMKSPKWKNNIKKLEKRYKQSLKLNLILSIVTAVSLLISLA